MPSPNIQRRISEINANVEQTQEEIGIRLTLLTIVFAIIEVIDIYVPAIVERVTLLGSFWSQIVPYQLVLLGSTGTFVVFLVTIFFLFETVFFSNLLRRPQFVTVYLKNEPRATDSDNGVHTQPVSWLTLMKGFARAPRTRLFVFMGVYLVLIAYILINVNLMNTDAAHICIFAIVASLGTITCHMLFPHVPRMRLFVFMGVYLVPLVWLLEVANATFLRFGYLPQLTLYVTYSAYLLSVLVSFLLGYKALVETKDAEVTRHEPLFHGSIYECVSVLPRKVHVGESYNILAELDRSEDRDNEPSTNDGVSIGGKRLEVDLKAAGVTIDGEKKWELSETSPIRTCLWNCHFKHAGLQTLNLVLREIQPSGGKHVIFRHRFDIKVNSAFSASIQPAIAIIISIISTIVIVMKAIYLR